jgi:hypothetical protein
VGSDNENNKSSQKIDEDKRIVTVFDALQKLQIPMAIHKRRI